MAGGECAECAKKKPALQRKLTIGSSNDPLELEADRIADQVVAKNAAPLPVSNLISGQLQREEAPKEKTNEEKLQEGLEKLGEAFLETPLGKELLEKIKQDGLTKGATDFISTWPGMIVTGAAATGAVAALAANHKELPAQIPEIPLDSLIPGLSVKLVYKGPVDKPTEAMITFKFTEQAAKNSADKKNISESDKDRAEADRIAADRDKFQAGLRYPPGSPEDLQQKAQQEAIRKVVQKNSGDPIIGAAGKKYPMFATPQPKNGLQLTMPKPPFGTQPPSLLGDQFKLRPLGEQKKKLDELPLQRKLSIGASNDPLEQEADRVADQVMAAPRHSAVNTTAPCIQRFTGQANESENVAPDSVDRVLASSGRPLEPALRQDMEQRFGHDFSRVRVHTDNAAEQSAREVNANAYTAGHNIVFGAGRFSSGTHEGRRLIAHELTHVAQQDRNSSLVLRREANSTQSLIGPSLWDQAFALADESRWEQVVEIVEGFSPENLRYFIQTYKNQPDKISQLYLGAIGNQKVGLDSKVARATKIIYLDFNFNEESRKANWSRAAFFVNEFSADDIRVRLKKLETEKLKALHEGAVTNNEVGIDSNAAKISAEVLASHSAKDEGKAPFLPTIRNLQALSDERLLKEYSSVLDARLVVDEEIFNSIQSEVFRRFQVISPGNIAHPARLTLISPTTGALTLAAVLPVGKSVAQFIEQNSSLIDQILEQTQQLETNTEGAIIDDILAQTAEGATEEGAAVAAEGAVEEGVGLAAEGAVEGGAGVVATVLGGALVILTFGMTIPSDTQIKKEPLPQSKKKKLTSAPSKGSPGRIISEKRVEGRMIIKSEVGLPPGKRLGTEKLLPTGLSVGRASWERAHSQGQITGAESGEGILLAPEEVNQAIQRTGIEQFISDLNSQKAADAQIFLTTETEAHPGTLALKSIVYRIEASRINQRSTILFEAEITVENKVDNPKIVISANQLTDEKPFLKDL